MSYFFAPYSYDRYRTFQGNAPGFAKLSHHLNASIEKQWERFQMNAGFILDMENQSRYQIAGDTVPDVGYNMFFPVGTNDTIISI